MTDSHIGFLVHDVARLMRKTFDHRMSELGLTRSQWWVIAYLLSYPGLTQQELADLLDVSPVSLGGLLLRLEEKDFVKRVPDSNDRRVKRVYLAQPESPLFTQVLERAGKLMDEAVDCLSAREQAQITRLLIKVKTNLLTLDAENSAASAMKREQRSQLATPAE